MNRVLLTGRLTRDPEMRGLASGKNVTTFTVASNEFIGGGKEKAEYQVKTKVCPITPDSANGRAILALAGQPSRDPGVVALHRARDSVSIQSASPRAQSGDRRPRRRHHSIGVRQPS